MIAYAVERDTSEWYEIRTNGYLLNPKLNKRLVNSGLNRIGISVEAMSAEVPVVASNAGGLPEVIEHGVTGYLHDSGHVDGFVAPVLRLLGNESLRRGMGRRARRVARERFNVDDMVARYVNVYDSLR